MKHRVSLITCLLFLLLASPYRLLATEVLAVPVTNPHDYIIMAVPFDHNNISVQIDTALPPDVAQIVRDAFNEWEKASQSGLKIAFLSLPPPYPHAGERCAWHCMEEDLLPEVQAYGFDVLVTATLNGATEGVTGATWTIDMEPQLHTVLRRFTDTRLFFNPSRVKEETGLLKSVCLHEVGHILFCSGHSARSEDIMSEGWEGSNFPRGLSPRDINTLLMAYPPDKKYPQPEKKEHLPGIIAKLLEIDNSRFKVLESAINRMPIQIDAAGAEIWYWDYSEGISKLKKVILSGNQLRAGDMVTVYGDWGYNIVRADDNDIMYEAVFKSVTSIRVLEFAASEPDPAKRTVPRAVSKTGKLYTSWGKIKTP